MKQILISVAAVVGIVLIVIFTPRYKITWIDKQNFIKTEQTSSLYKRSKGKENLYWDKIALYAGATILAAGVLVFLSRDKHG
jgi:hypothetical protein